MIIVEAGDTSGAGALEADFLRALVPLHAALVALPGYEELCLRAGSGTDAPCLVASPLTAWGYNLTGISTDAVLAKLSPPSFFAPPPLGYTVSTSQLVGSPARNASGALRSAGAVQLVYVMSPAADEAGLERFEAALLDVAHAWAAALPPAGRVFVQAPRSYQDESDAVIAADSPLVGGAIALMFVYVSLVLGGAPPVASQVSLGLTVIATVGSSMLVGFGFGAYIGVPFNVMSQLAIFVLTGVSVDDAFVVTDCFARTPPSAPLHARMRAALREAGPSITLTSLTDLLAFCIGSTVDVPAIQAFCATAAISVSAVFVLQCTLLAPAIVLDAMRQQQRRYDVCCCWKAPPEDEQEGAKVVEWAAPAGALEETSLAALPAPLAAVEPAQADCKAAPTAEGGAVMTPTDGSAAEVGAADEGDDEGASVGTSAWRDEAGEGPEEVVAGEGVGQEGVSKGAVEEGTAGGEGSEDADSAEGAAEEQAVSEPTAAEPATAGVKVVGEAAAPVEEASLAVGDTCGSDDTAAVVVEVQAPAPEVSADSTAKPAVAGPGAVGGAAAPSAHWESEEVEVSTEDDPSRDSCMRSFVRHQCAPRLLQLPVRVGVVVVFLGGAAWAAVNATRTSKGLNASDYLPSESYLIDFYDAREAHFGTVEDTNIWVLGAGNSAGLGGAEALRQPGYVPPDRANDFTWARRAQAGGVWSNWGAAPHRAAVEEVHARVSGEVPGVRLPLTTWWTALGAWEATLPAAAVAAGSANATAFGAHVAWWLRSDPVALQFAGDVAFADASSGRRVPTAAVLADSGRQLPPFVLAACQLKAEVLVPQDSPAHVRLMMRVRGVPQGLYPPGAAGGAAGPALSGFGFAYDHLWLERYRIVDRLAAQNLLYAGASVLGCLLLFHPPLSALLVLLTVGMVDVAILGTMFAWDIPLNVASVVNLVMAVGLSIDYSAHIAHAFAHAQGDRVSRARHALVTMGASVLNGGLSTLLAVLLLAFAQSGGFRVLFKMFLCLVGYGLLHGLVFLPALLSFVGPAPLPLPHPGPRKAAPLP